MSEERTYEIQNTAPTTVSDFAALVRDFILWPWTPNDHQDGGDETGEAQPAEASPVSTPTEER